MVTRWTWTTTSPAGTAAAAPGVAVAITFGRLVLMTGLCGILWVVSIDFNGPVANQQQQMGQGLGTNIINKTETTLSDEVSKEYHPFRLTVPFYVYENRDLNWEDATLDGEPYEPIAPHGGGAGTYVALFRHAHFNGNGKTSMIVCLSRPVVSFLFIVRQTANIPTTTGTCARR
jgi:hypothetical protein